MRFQYKKIDNACIETVRKRKAEKHLYALLDKACQSVDIQLGEWDVDKKLFMAIISSPKASSRKSRQLFVDYDNSYLLLKELEIKIPTKYSWFTNTLDHIQ
jgi:hypothetical protein